MPPDVRLMMICNDIDYIERQRDEMLVKAEYANSPHIASHCYDKANLTILSSDYYCTSFQTSFKVVFVNLNLSSINYVNLNLNSIKVVNLDSLINVSLINVRLINVSLINVSLINVNS